MSFVEYFYLQHDARTDRLGEVEWLIGWHNKQGFILCGFETLSIEYFETKLLNADCH